MGRPEDPAGSAVGLIVRHTAQRWTGRVTAEDPAGTLEVQPVFGGQPRWYLAGEFEFIAAVGVDHEGNPDRFTVDSAGRKLFD